MKAMTYSFKLALVSIMVASFILCPLSALAQKKKVSYIPGWIGSVAVALSDYHKKHGQFSGGMTEKHKEMLEFIAEAVPSVKTQKPTNIGTYTSIGTISIKYDPTITDQTKSYIKSSVQFWNPACKALHNKVLIHEDGKDTFVIWFYKVEFPQPSGKGDLLIFRKCKK